MRIAKIAAVLLAPLAAATLPASVASAQTACRWSTPAFVGYDGWPESHFVAVESKCNGGITRCACRIKTFVWVYDPLADEWRIFGDNPRYSADFEYACGTTFRLGRSVGDWELPEGAFCCLEMEFWSKSGTTYTYMGSGYQYFYTP